MRLDTTYLDCMVEHALVLSQHIVSEAPKNEFASLTSGTDICVKIKALIDMP